MSASAFITRRTFAFAGVLLPVSVRPHEGGQEKRHSADGDFPVQQKTFGIAGKLKEQTRTVFIDMGDDMRFKPDRLEVALDQTVRFVFRNKGAVVHEWVLGEDAELRKHAEMMRMHPDMHHDEVHMIHVPPKKSGEIVWRFNRAGTFKFACLIPGHFEAGMVGTVTVKPAAAKR